MAYGVRIMRSGGGLAERLNALVLKTSEGVSPPRVRIPDPPPLDTKLSSSLTPMRGNGHPSNPIKDLSQSHHD